MKRKGGLITWSLFIFLFLAGWYWVEAQGYTPIKPVTQTANIISSVLSEGKNPKKLPGSTKSQTEAARQSIIAKLRESIKQLIVLLERELRQKMAASETAGRLSERLKNTAQAVSSSAKTGANAVESWSDRVWTAGKEAGASVVSPITMPAEPISPQTEEFSQNLNLSINENELFANGFVVQSVTGNNLVVYYKKKSVQLELTVITNDQTEIFNRSGTQKINVGEIKKGDVISVKGEVIEKNGNEATVAASDIHLWTEH